MAMESFTALIDSIGVPTLAKAFGVEESHVRTMKARDSIPPEYWGLLIEEAPKHRVKGVSWKALRALRDARFGREREPARQSA